MEENTREETPPPAPHILEAVDVVRSFLRRLREERPQLIEGEEIEWIRDEETARIAVQAALTGHLVLSTLHTNSAVGAITRLLDMGIEPYLLASCLRGVVAQRLVRRVCHKCEACGCEDCFGTGYSGRLAVQEVMTVNDEIRHLITGRAAEKDILTAAEGNGFVSLYDDGMKKVLAGATTLTELLRISEVDVK